MVQGGYIFQMGHLISY